MFKCLECGHIFESGEEARWKEPCGESMTGCPLCKGVYEPTKRCQVCGKECLGDEIYGLWCEECLRNEINYKTFLDYLLSEKRLLCDFMFDKYFEVDAPSTVSDALQRTMRELFLRQAADDRITNRHVFLDLCESFAMEDNSSREHFGSWLKWRRLSENVVLAANNLWR